MTGPAVRVQWRELDIDPAFLAASPAAPDYLRTAASLLHADAITLLAKYLQAEYELSLAALGMDTASDGGDEPGPFVFEVPMPLVADVPEAPVRYHITLPPQAKEAAPTPPPVEPVVSGSVGAPPPPELEAAVPEAEPVTGGEQPGAAYRCDICAREFTRAQALGRHKGTHQAADHGYVELTDGNPSDRCNCWHVRFRHDESGLCQVGNCDCPGFQAAAA